MQQNFEPINEDFYTQEKRVNEKQEWLKNTAHINADISIAQQQANLQVTIPSALSKHLSQGTLELYALDEKKHDVKFDIEPNETGIYNINISQVPKINYIAKLKFEAQDSTFYKEVSLKIYQP